MGKLTTLVFIALSMMGYGQGNTKCATDEAMNNLFGNPATRMLHQQIENRIYNNGNPVHRGSRATYLLPVVIHIVHNGGPENISDVQARQAIDYLNESFRNTTLYDSTDGVNTNIQFCLAKQNPQGQATTGINRVQTALTSTSITNDLALKNLIRWDPTRYINIWVVKEICSGGSCGSVAGFAYFPSAHGTSIDGIVVIASMTGSSTAKTAVLTHEMGHYLGLYHTFEGGCTNNNCLTDGDKVCDTPPDNSTANISCNGSMNSCTTDAQSGFATDQPDMHHNYMDYTTLACMTIYTADQRDRMQWHISNVRSSLTTCTSCLNPCTSNITAGFTVVNDTVAAGSNVSFINGSAGAATYKWYMNGVQFSTQPGPAYTFNTVGTYIIKLETRGTDTNCIAFFADTIVVNCDAVAQFGSSITNPAAGQAVTFTNLSTGATSYSWFVDGVQMATSQNYTHTFAQAGDYAVYLIASSAKCSDTTSITNFVHVGAVCRPSFTYLPVPATTCLDVILKPDTACNFSSYLWSFCDAQLDLTTVQTKSFQHPVSNSTLAGIELVKSQSGKYYGFYGGYNITSSPYFFRLDFGTSANNTPVRVAINTPAIVNGYRPHGIDIVYENGQYYGFILFNTEIYRLDFGTNIENTSPAVSLVTGFSNMGWGHKIAIVKESNNWWLLVAGRATSSLNTMYLGNSITNNVQSSIAHSVNACSGFSYHKINGSHTIWATGLFDGIKRFDFGNSLANTPTASGYMLAGADLHDDIALYVNCDGSLDGIVIKEDNTTHTLVHLDSIKAVPTVTHTFSNTLQRSAGISRLMRTDAGLTALMIQSYSSAIGWVNFTDCGVPYSNQQYPPAISYPVAGTYRVRLTVDEGLPTQQVYCDDIVVTGTLKPINLGPDTSFCVGGVKVLNAGGGYKRYKWQDNSGDSTFSAYGAGKYYVEAEDFCGRIFRDTVTITVDSARAVDLGNDTTVCNGNGVELKLNSLFGKHVYTPGNVSVTSCPGCPNPVVYPTDTTTYTVTSVSGDGCIAAASVTVNVIRCDSFERKVIAETICQGDSFLFAGRWLKITGTYTDTLFGATDTIYLLQLTVNRCNSNSVTKNIQATICQGDSVFLVDKWLKNEGAYTDTLPGSIDTIYILQLKVLPVPVIDLGNDTVHCDNLLQLSVPDGYEVLWSTGERTNTININRAGLYSVSVKDSNQCSASDSILIGLDCDFEMPNVFTPNGDGANDLFFPVFESGSTAVEYLRVYNRWGQLIYDGREGSKGWDGKYKTVEQPNGTYFYSVVVGWPDGSTKGKSGSFTLIR